MKKFSRWKLRLCTAALVFLVAAVVLVVPSNVDTVSPVFHYDIGGR